MNGKSIVIVLLAVLLIVLPLSAGLVYAEDDETSLEAQVEVLPAIEVSYGASVVQMRSTFFPFWALREPDWRAAYMFRNGWMSIRLESTVKNTDRISVWAAGGGWPYSRIRIYVSEDGKHWTQVKNMTVRHPALIRYDTTGSFGDVRYIKVRQSGGRWSFVRLDAVCAEGGES
jgi:hypothetical protein